MNALVKYDFMCRAIAEAMAVDEVKAIRDKAEAMRVYARQAKNRKLEIDAAEIRLRAERRLGEMICFQKKTAGLNPGARGNPRGRGAKIVSFQNGRAHPTLATVGIDYKLSSRAQKLAGLSANDFEGRVAKWRSKTEQDGEQITTKFMHGTIYAKAAFTGDNDWHTPRSYIERVRKFLGIIDLDPATSPLAQKTVKARRFYTAPDDGLSRYWSGRVFLNPPYSRELLPLFAAKLISEYKAGNVSEAVCLTHNFTDTDWFHTLASAASAICFTRGRIKFLDADGNKASPTQGQAFIYFGRRHRRFAAHFRSVGLVVAPVS